MAMTAIWVSVLIWVFFPLGAPIINLPGDFIDTQTVTVGGKVNVVRNLQVKRQEAVMVHRSMIRGDCSKSCEIINLASSSLMLKVGDYHSVTFTHQLPSIVEPGDWRLVSTTEWIDRIGGSHIESLAELAIKVTR